MLKLHKQNKRTKKLISFFLSLFKQSWIISITLIFLLYVSCYSTISCWSKLAPDSLFSKYIPHGGHHHAQYNISRLNFTYIFSNGEGLNSSKYSTLKKEVVWSVSQIIQIVISSRPRKSPHEKFARQPNWRAEWKWRKREFREKLGVRREPFRTGEDKTWTRVRKHPLWTGSTDHHHGPGPWTLF